MLPIRLAAITLVCHCLLAPSAVRSNEGKNGHIVVPAELRFEPQWREKGDCGRCALYILARLEGREISMIQMKETIRIDPDTGCSMADLARAADGLGFPVEIRFVSPREMPQLPCPYVLHWNGSLKTGVGHFAVITGYSKDLKQYSLIDAQFDESRFVPEAALARSHSGYVLIPHRSGSMRFSAMGSLALIFLAALLWMWRR